MGSTRVGRILAVPVFLLATLTAAGQETRVTVAPGECLRVVQAGLGEPIVLIPGQFGSAFGFRKLFVPLAEHGRRAIVVEPLGVGESCRPAKADYSLTAQADRVAAVLKELGVGPTVVVAHAVGASIAFRLALRHPELVKGIVSLEGGVAESAATPGFRRAMRFSFLIKLFGGKSRIRRTVRSMLEEHSADPTWVTDDIVDGYMGYAARDLDGTLRAFKQMAAAREPELLAPHLPELRCPVRLLLGQATRKGGIGEAELALMASRVPGIQIERVAHAGHFLFEEAPQAVMASIDRSLANPGPLALAGGGAR